MKRHIIKINTALFLTLTASSFLFADETDNLMISVSTGNEEMLVSLNDTPTSRDLLTILPLTLTLDDYGKAEKNSNKLPKPLSLEGAPEMDAGSIGDLVYYAPWNNIAFFREDGGTYRGVVKIGKIISGKEIIERYGKITISINKKQ